MLISTWYMDLVGWCGLVSLFTILESECISLLYNFKLLCPKIASPIAIIFLCLFSIPNFTRAIAFSHSKCVDFFWFSIENEFNYFVNRELNIMKLQLCITKPFYPDPNDWFYLIWIIYSTTSSTKNGTDDSPLISAAKNGD